jgi:hypothetical protein
MRHKRIGKTLLSSVSMGSPCSSELQGDKIIVRFLGLITIHQIHLSDVHYLRLATRDEVSPAYLLFNWLQFLPHRRSVRPVYILQSRNRQRLFLKLEGGAHFKLRQAIARKSGSPQRIAA